MDEHDDPYECPNCGGSLDWHDCHNCEDGYSHHDCGDDTCCCRYPEDNVRCDVCQGAGGWYTCHGDAEGCVSWSPRELEAIAKGERRS
jgi:hypothetical protein